MNNRNFLTALVFSLSISSLSLAYDYNTVGYTQIKELKSWDGHIDVYLVGDQVHKCSQNQTTRFISDPEQQNHYSLLMAAFLGEKEVSLAYDCISGIPNIVGVRVR